MADTPMVIMWINSDGTATLSQRKASTEVMPTVDSNPTRTATFSTALSLVWQQTPYYCLSFSRRYLVSAAFLFETFFCFHDSGGCLAIADKRRPITYTSPSSPTVIRNNHSSMHSEPQTLARPQSLPTLVQHYDYGAIQLDLTKDLTSTSTGSSSPTSTVQPVAPASIPLLSYQKMIVAHAIFCTVGFLLFLPAGAFIGSLPENLRPGTHVVQRPRHLTILHW